jgi:phosphoserine phosphatase RsbU/P
VSTLAERLEVLCEVNRRLATFTSLDDLLRFATQRARELFDAEGCALLLVDEGSGEFRFPVSSQSAGSHASSARLEDIRFPITKGVAGWVLSHGEAVAVDDVQRDARFYSGVDEASGTRTRSILCAPLRSGDGAIGVIEVINPGPRTEGDLAFLEALGSDVAVAHEKATLHAALRAEVTGLRRLVRAGGVVLGAIGGGLVGAAVVAHLARALPVSELGTSPGVLLGVLIGLAGVALTLAMRRVPSTV